MNLNIVWIDRYAINLLRVYKSVSSYVSATHNLPGIIFLADYRDKSVCVVYATRSAFPSSRHRRFIYVSAISRHYFLVAVKQTNSSCAHVSPFLYVEQVIDRLANEDRLRAC